MKKLNLLGLLAVAASMGVSLAAGVSSVSEAKAGISDEHFFNAGEEINYGSFAGIPEFQGQDGLRLCAGNFTSQTLLSKVGDKYVSGENVTSTSIESGMAKPGSRGLVIQWTAPKTATYKVKGMLYNHYAFTTTEDLSGKGVAAREQGSSATRDGVTISTKFTSSFGWNQSGKYVVEDLSSDFTLYVNRAYYCNAGDKLTMVINGKSDFTEDDVSYYFSIYENDTIVNYDLNHAGGQYLDTVGTVNNLNKWTSTEKVVCDPAKGVHFNAGAEGDNLHVLTDNRFDPNTPSVNDVTDNLEDFCIHVKFTIEGEANDWAIIFSTTAYDLWDKGIGLGLNSMGTRDNNNKLKYSLRVRVKGTDGGYWDNPNSGWTNDLVDGGTYDVYINVSKRLGKVESICTGNYQNGWVGTNISAVKSLDSNWTMNLNQTALMLGNVNRDYNNLFHGWISKFEVLNKVKEFHKNDVSGPFREPDIQPVSISGVDALAAVDYDADAATMIAAAPQTATLNLSSESSTTDAIAWNTKPVYTLGQAYLAGTTNQAKCGGKAQSVKTTINAAVVTLVNDGEYSYKPFAIGAANTLPATGEHCSYKYYTDSAMTQEFTASTIDESVKLYVKTTIDPSYEAGVFAADFNSKVGAICDASGSTVIATLQTEWATQASNFATLSAEAKAILKACDGKGVTDVDDCVKKYDYIINKYGDTAFADFMDRFEGPVIPSQVLEHNALSTNDSTTATVIAIVSIVCVISLGCLVSIKRIKKSKSK